MLATEAVEAGETASTRSSKPSSGTSAISAAVAQSMPAEEGDAGEDLEEDLHRNGGEEDAVVKEDALIFAVDENKRCRNRFVRSLLAILDRRVTGGFLCF